MAKILDLPLAFEGIIDRIEQMREEFAHASKAGRDTSWKPELSLVR
jgi:hypothetical protein